MWIPWKLTRGLPDRPLGARRGKLPTLPISHKYGPALKTLIETLLRRALTTLPEDLLPASLRSSAVEIERTRDAQHGDFASNIAMQLAKATRQNPRKLAQALLAGVPPARGHRQSRDRRRRLPQLFRERGRVSRRDRAGAG